MYFPRGTGRRPVRRSSVQVLRRSQCEECAIMDNEGRFSISAQALYSRLGTELAPIIAAVRRNPAFEADDTVIVGAVRRLPEEVDHWCSGLPVPSSSIVLTARKSAKIRRQRYALPRATPLTSNMALRVGPNSGSRAAASS